MIACYKCGRDLPGMEVECEDGCRVGSAPQFPQTLEQNGAMIAFALVHHVIHEAKASGYRMLVRDQVSGQEFEVIVRKIGGQPS